MAALEWWWWWQPLSGWLGSSSAWFVFLNVVVAAIAVLSLRARAPSSPSARLGGISRRASSAVLQRLTSFSIFSFPSACFNTWPATPVAVKEAEEPGTARKQPSRPSALAPPASAELAPEAEDDDDDEEEEEDPNSMSMEDVYALVLAGRQRPPPTDEEARRSEVDAKAAEFIRGFKEDERQQRLDSMAKYTQMLRGRALKEDERQQRLDSIANYTQMLRDRALAAGRRRLQA